ncbi:MAG TPA: DUF4389 domain-containing protein [Solirubrobacteraceae bacterium]|jgi:hypothetical protein|nr:DUF4389 domain-containing protein [Solirubrobacteraceae bacterium]
MSAYPVAYQQSPPVERNRLTVFFRVFMLIPHLIWAYLYGIGAFIVTFLAWFALLFTGRYPGGMYDFVAGYLRFITRVYGYGLLITDVYPPFDGGEHPEYPVRLIIGPPQESYNRASVFFRIILLIPVFIVQYAFEIWLFFVAVALWFVAVITGRTSPGLTEAAHFPLSYFARSSAYVYLLTDKFTPLSDTDTSSVLPPVSNH